MVWNVNVQSYCFMMCLGLPNLKKKFYVEDPVIATMSDTEVYDFW